MFRLILLLLLSSPLVKFLRLPLCLYLSLLVELLSRPPLQMLPLCHFATLPAGRAQASDVFERLKLAQSSADELGDDRPRSELDPTIAGWKAVGKADICHKYHELYSRRKNCHAEKFQLSMYDTCGKIENFSTCREISVQLMGFYCNLCCFVAKSVIRAVLSQNFCHNLPAFMWRKIEPKSTFVEKNDKYKVWLSGA